MTLCPKVLFPFDLRQERGICKSADNCTSSSQKEHFKSLFESLYPKSGQIHSKPIEWYPLGMKTPHPNGWERFG